MVQFECPKDRKPCVSSILGESLFLIVLPISGTLRSQVVLDSQGVA